MAARERGRILRGGNPLAQRRVLGEELRRLRQRSNLTADQAGSMIDRSGSWISRLELGLIGLRPRDLKDLLEIYGVREASVRNELEALAVAGRRRAWWSSYRDVLSEFYTTLIGLEDEAAEIYEFQDRVIPGLVQTESYMRTLYSHYANLAPHVYPSVDRLIEVRLERQKVLHRASSSPAFEVVLDQAVLHRVFGDRAVHREQLEALLAAGNSGVVSIRLLAFGDIRAPAFYEPFVLIRSSSGRLTAVVESGSGRGSIVAGGSAGIYEDAFKSLSRDARDAESSLQLLEAILHSNGDFHEQVRPH
ncbi:MULTISPECIES: helix-turn-helix domain-containing protein [Catenuloplanes]|uniref:Transcriptional regulator with XRE-family HTH domain n=1 Tax=Catenuloplanes niger TaxID=587534 RepID=A0AAE4CT79_9ACTN|nr:helix-turn-helix transcriptional regulator [Catenuloplanes niger]MDR7323800.1 transcriptional regulator with XRE-family HTH domain [Catenuloplanes niger]